MISTGARLAFRTWWLTDPSSSERISPRPREPITTKSCRPLSTCSIYGNKAAGDKLIAMLKLGASRPWPDALEVLSGERQADASAMLEYFEPLRAWLREQNKGQTCGW